MLNYPTILCLYCSFSTFYLIVHNVGSCQVVSVYFTVILKLNDVMGNDTIPS